MHAKYATSMGPQVLLVDWWLCQSKDQWQNNHFHGQSSIEVAWWRQRPNSLRPMTLCFSHNHYFLEILASSTVMTNTLITAQPELILPCQTLARGPPNCYHISDGQWRLVDQPSQLMAGQHCVSWKKVKEYTSSSPSSIHFGHYKDGMYHDSINALHAAMTNIPLIYILKMAQWNRCDTGEKARQLPDWPSSLHC